LGAEGRRFKSCHPDHENGLRPAKRGGHHSKGRPPCRSFGVIDPVQTGSQQGRMNRRRPGRRSSVSPPEAMPGADQARRRLRAGGSLGPLSLRRWGPIFGSEPFFYSTFAKCSNTCSHYNAATLTPDLLHSQDGGRRRRQRVSGWAGEIGRSTTAAGPHPPKGGSPIPGQAVPSAGCQPPASWCENGMPDRRRDRPPTKEGNPTHVNTTQGRARHRRQPRSRPQHGRGRPAHAEADLGSGQLRHPGQ
jgi:hypothetical protein